MKRKFFKGILILASVCVIFASVACNPSSTDQPSDPTKEVSIVVDDLVEDKIGFNNWLQKRQKEFDAAYPKIEVKHVAEVSTDSFNQLKSVRDTFSVVSPATPTILKVNTNEYARQLYYEGYIKPFTAPINEWSEKDDIRANILDGYTYNGEIVGFPITLETPLLGFNKTILKERRQALAEIGQQYDALRIETWEDYREIAKALTYRNESGTQIAGMGMTTQDYYQSFGVWAIANGFDGVIQNDDGTVDIDWENNVSMIETLQHFAKMKQDGSIAYNIDVNITTYFGYIWRGNIASFTYYPEWATWFAQNNLDSDNIDIYPFPVGENAKKENIEVNSPIFTIGYVANAKASDEQVAAAAKYIEFMYGKEAWDSKINFAYENMIQFVTYPALTSVDLDKIYEDLSENWINAIEYVMQHMYVGKVNTVGYITDIRSALSDLVQDPSETAINSQLATLENTTKLSWLNAYNQNVKKGN